MMAHRAPLIVALRVPGSAVPLSPRQAAPTIETMTTTLITGANKGLGHEAARRLVAEGHDVWVAARDADRGKAAADALGARFVVLDVRDEESVAAAAEHVGANGGLDVLVNNAGIAYPPDGLENDSPAAIAAILDTNVVGIARVTHAFTPLLERSGNPVIVNVSSGMGSIASTTDPDRIESTIASLGYASSKAAVNMLTTQYAKALPGMRVNAVDPGYTATDFNGHSGPQTVEEGTDAMVEMAQVGPDGPTGTFTDRNGPAAF
ncbi:MAG: Short-chain dehydrogenase/reductase SDR [uncultured Solirubrobacteraceae bacterium]|uniref:Short-chain dehydrogenase/reductase SDR n=1 Tax=uncultured Solirubrobacteraceae bacterium TaxID=1162706 RepID=A0A6J4TMK1_9ACTN|nr:MAG: Short-chain dehydrogenase/reductase SDR [uncultured Solirubrobacteraceae bacterium]